MEQTCDARVVEVFPQERISDRLRERNVDNHVRQILEDIVEVMLLTTRERSQQRTEEDVLDPQTVLSHLSQRHLERISVTSVFLHRHALLDGRVVLDVPRLNWMIEFLPFWAGCQISKEIRRVSGQSLASLH